jgi:hypothetical protein
LITTEYVTEQQYSKNFVENYLASADDELNKLFSLNDQTLIFDRLNSEEVTQYGETTRQYKRDAPLKYKF